MVLLPLFVHQFIMIFNILEILEQDLNIFWYLSNYNQIL